jgi:hypothetical protein
MIPLPPKPSKRRFTKLTLMLNGAAAWGLLFYAAYKGQLQWVAFDALLFLGVLFGIYPVVGHLDLRAVLKRPLPPDPYGMYNMGETTDPNYPKEE